MQVQSPDFFIAPFSGFRVLGQYQVVHTDFTDCLLSFYSWDQGPPGKASALGFCHFCGGDAAALYFPPDAVPNAVRGFIDGFIDCLFCSAANFSCHQGVAGHVEYQNDKSSI